MLSLRKINWQKTLLAGIMFLIITQIVRQVEVLLTMNYYTMPQYFEVWSRLMMPKAGPPPASFLLTSLLFTFITGVVLAIFYEWVKGLLPKEMGQRVSAFTILLFLLSFVFFSLPVYLLINLPFELLFVWLISTILIFFFSSIAFVKILK